MSSPGEEDGGLGVRVVRLQGVKHVIQVLSAAQLWEAR